MKKAGSRRESNPGHLWLEPPALCHWATTAGQPPTLYIYCTGGTECLSRTPGSHSVCAVRTLLGVDRKILSVRKEPMLSCFSHSKCKQHLALLWGANRGKWKRPAAAGSRTQDTSGLSRRALPLSHDSQTTTNPHLNQSLLPQGLFDCCNVTMPPRIFFMLEQMCNYTPAY